jgi:hypothetical protein
MKNLPSWVTTLVLVLTVPALTAATCVGGGGVKQACDLGERRAPHWVAGRGKGTIDATIHAYCDPAPRWHNLTIWLEREASGADTWLQVGNTETWDSAKDIPPPPPGRDYVISHGCIDGNWRVRARATGESPDGTPFRFSLPVDEVHISVVKCRLQ